MKYIPLDEYRKGWIFRHKDLPVSAEDLAAIKPVAAERAEQIWALQVSQNCDHPREFDTGDWAVRNDVWQEEPGDWQGPWDSDEPELPAIVAEHFDWDDQTVVWFCYESDHIIETTWAVFRRNWKNFLFMDDGPLLIGRKRKQVAQFFETGQVRVGSRP
ncbi:DUF2947 domain-containing protein [Marinobacterium arenosum]|uniref:DUF2947 domain-containing protein n=1 Tax=Marinobacterium arenosum TaxID=2862496 RepID=UPI001C964E17|nr:DUF2947 domain-containing protein [Marinobacterium arenosum]MBY4675104.1 DUF2947 domain-containing protein [Marinobacterium arenosum]